ncbi:alkaline phosphatase family protein [Actinomadura harenae]|uniref:Uncharacterized protein n=1 Tax=Actinomadura harenae TaxID=2483351 RepID=A0A3M2LFG1_9ACTN|nr:hypothetical protein [Actinomadura harenae]RMI36202.1 hypothetical protein EBO15_39280 [Actinomadura harenae]
MVLWPVPASAEAGTGPRPVVVLGVRALSWADITPGGTPNLWRLAGRAGLANVSVRTVRDTTCPADGWLTLSAGQRASVDDCAHPSPFAVLRERNRHGRYRADVGALGSAFHAAGLRTAASGPDAALGAADATGQVDTASTPAALTLVDVENAREADAALRGVPADAAVFVVGISDAPGHAALHPLLTSGDATRYLTSASTRRTGLVTLTDLTPSILAAAGLRPTAAMIGEAWRPAGGRVAPERAVRRLAGDAEAARIGENLRGPFWTATIAIELALLVPLLIAGRRWPRLRAVTRVLALAAMAVPQATYLVDLFPWHTASSLVTGIAVLTAVLGLAASRLPSPVAGAVAVAGTTAAVSALDVLTGSRLQWNSLTGYNGIVAGRFYGLSNLAFAVFATSVLLAVTLAAGPLAERGRRRAAVLAVAGTGLAALAITAWPDAGAKFGGTLAFAPGIAVSALVIAGRRISPAKLGLGCAAGVAAVTALVLADHARPAAAQTHLGRFATRVGDGEAGAIVGRKLDAMLHTVGGSVPLTVAALAVVAVLAGLALRPPRPVAAWLAGHGTLRAGLAGVAATAAVGAVVQDSGFAVPSMALRLTVPLLVALAPRP